MDDVPNLSAVISTALGNGMVKGAWDERMWDDCGKVLIGTGTIFNLFFSQWAALCFLSREDSLQFQHQVQFQFQ